MLLFSCLVFFPSDGPPGQLGLHALYGGAFLIAVVLLARAWTSSPPRRRWGQGSGTYTYVDGLYVWDVAPHQILVRPVFCSTGTYQDALAGTPTHVALRSAGRSEHIDVPSKAHGSDLADFMCEMATTHGKLSARQREQFRRNPTLLPAWTRQLRGDPRFRALRSVREFTPTPVVPDGLDQPRGQPIMALASAGLLGVLVATLVIPRIDTRMRDEAYYARVLRSPQDSFEAIDAYRADFPGGKYSRQVDEVRDDRVFTIAAKQAKRGEDPEPLRAYLRDPTVERHDGAARFQVGGIYDKAMRRLEGLASAGSSDPRLLSALLDVLDALKGTRSSVVGVTFHPRHSPAPGNQSERETERRQVAAYRLRYADTHVEGLYGPSGRIASCPPGRVSSLSTSRRANRSSSVD